MSTATTSTQDELGELLAEIRRGSRTVALGMLTMAGCLVVGCFGLALLEPVAAAPALVFPLLLGGLGWWGMRHAVRIYSGGIEVDGFIGRTRLRFDEAETLEYRSLAKSVNGIPVGTYVWARMRTGTRTATFNMRAENASAEALNEFRALASDAIVARAWDRIRAGESFRWGRTQVLDRDFLRYRPAGLLGPKPERTTPYSRLRYAFNAGSFSVYPQGSDRALFTMRCDEPNFYPGFALFEYLTAAR